MNRIKNSEYNYLEAPTNEEPCIVGNNGGPKWPECGGGNNWIGAVLIFGGRCSGRESRSCSPRDKLNAGEGIWLLTDVGGIADENAPLPGYLNDWNFDISTFSSDLKWGAKNDLILTGDANQMILAGDVSLGAWPLMYLEVQSN